MSQNVSQTGAGEGEARGYSWPPFEPGNTAALTHGATSNALVNPRAEELIPALYETFTHLDPVKDSLAVKRLAKVVVRLELADAWLNQQDDPIFADPRRGKPHRVLERVERWERQATGLEQHLSMSPQARIQIERLLLKSGASGLKSFIDGGGKE
jgi:hypothetical protein